MKLTDGTKECRIVIYLGCFHPDVIQHVTLLFNEINKLTSNVTHSKDGTTEEILSRLMFVGVALTPDWRHNYTLVVLNTATL